jgi:hypothetical protein
MNSSFWRVPTLTVLATLLAVAGSAQGSEAGNWQGFVSLTPVYQGNADLDRGGDFSVGGAILRGGVAKDLGGGTRAGITLTYDYLDYSFSNSGAFGRVEPWGIVQRYGVSVPLSFEVGDGWSVGVAPSVDWFKENGADSGDSLTWGATVSGSRRFEGGNRLGLGLGVFDGIEKTSVFPFVVVDWRFGDRWRLINPLPSGPTGPAGLELDYRFDGGWTAGVGVAYRVLRFRLNETGAARNGVGEESGVPVFVRLTRNFTDQMALHLYGGVVAGGKLRVENSSGHKVSDEDFDPAPLFGATFVGRF